MAVTEILARSGDPYLFGDEPVETLTITHDIQEAFLAAIIPIGRQPDGTSFPALDHEKLNINLIKSGMSLEQAQNDGFVLGVLFNDLVQWRSNPQDTNASLLNRAVTVLCESMNIDRFSVEDRIVEQTHAWSRNRISQNFYHYLSLLD